MLHRQPKWKWWSNLWLLVTNNRCIKDVLKIYIKSLVCVSVLWIVLVLLTFLNCYMSTLRPIHYALLLTQACWKSSNTNTRVMAFVLSLALDPTFGIYSHKTLGTAQLCHLLKPNWKRSSSQSISTPTNIYSQFLLQPVCVCVCFHIYNTLCKLFCRTVLYVCIEYCV